jgi:hypothetical protein
VNDISLHRAKEPVVQVVDSAGRPIAGAAVSFQLPPYGASGRFADSALNLTAITDSRGQAVGRGLQPNDTAGRFRIRVTASYRGQTANAELTEINAEGATAHHVSSKKIALIAIIGGAAAGGALVALRGGKSSSPASATVPAGVSVSAGSPSMGPPQ